MGFWAWSFGILHDESCEEVQRNASNGLASGGNDEGSKSFPDPSAGRSASSSAVREDGIEDDGQTGSRGNACDRAARGGIGEATLERRGIGIDSHSSNLTLFAQVRAGLRQNGVEMQWPVSA
jgi:hypothetical protein